MGAIPDLPRVLHVPVCLFFFLVIPMNSFPYFQFSPDKWLIGKISSFDLEHQALFLHFCMLAWIGNGEFSICSPTLCRRFGKGKEWIDCAISDFVQSCIMVETENGTMQIKFISEQIEQLLKIREKRSFAGITSALRKKTNGVVDTIQEKRREKETREEKRREEKYVQHAPTCVEHVLHTCSDKSERCATASDPAFDRFWSAWPAHFRKTNKGGCLKKWKAMKLSEDIDAIINGVEAWKKSESWAKDDGQFIPMPMTFINRRQWEDLDAAKATHFAPEREPYPTETGWPSSLPEGFRGDNEL